MSDEIIRSLGYNIPLERKDQLEANGLDPARMLAQFREEFPEFNINADPLGVFDILNQGGQGACVGHMLAAIFSMCYFLATGRRLAFSRAAGYYLSQKIAGISGDRGSTVHAAQQLATGKGMCLESEWPYPDSYDPQQPAGVQFRFKLKVSRPLRSLQEVTDWQDSGLPIGSGHSWGSASDREIVDNWEPGKGGHSTIFFQRKANGNSIMPNSWGKKWMLDGCNEWTPRAMKEMIAHPHSVLVGFAPDEMDFPTPDPI